jgi:5-methylcytosine-specific restriction endonuclease McrA
MNKNNNYTRVGVVSLGILSTLKNRKKKNEYIELFGVSVKTTSQRYAVFQKNIACCKCGIKGKFLAVEKNVPSHISSNYHFNLYAVDDDGNEVLMTKDHIHPKSKGGKNILDNYQTMCQKCNIEKGNTIEPTGIHPPAIVVYKRRTKINPENND